MNDLELVYEYSRVMEHDKWLPLIPAITMKEGWTVTFLPPRGGALCRMRINGYSIYLDAYDNLGCMYEPYWEIYDGENCQRFLMDNVKGLEDRISELPVL